MRIVIDLQGAQSISRFQEIGHYSIEITKAIIRNAPQHEIILAVNASLPDAIDSIRIQFKDLIPQENIRAWQAPSFTAFAYAENHHTAKIAEHFREAFLASLKPDVVHIWNLFEGLYDDAITSIGIFENSLPTSVMLHDSIDLTCNYQHLEDRIYQQWHAQKLGHLRRAHLYFTTSDAKRHTSIEQLGLLDDQAMNILVDGSATSYDASAKCIVSAFEQLHTKNNQIKLTTTYPQHIQRPRLAYLSPLSPAKTGIAVYSMDLLPQLSRHYEIDVILNQEVTAIDPWIQANCNIRNVLWFQQHYSQFDRVVYQIGNSASHEFMFKLMEHYPGVIVLHDFFLSGIGYHIDVISQPGSNYWAKQLYISHGYKAIQERIHRNDDRYVAYTYPCSLSLLNQSLGVIVHSQYAYDLAKKFYGSEYPEYHQWAIVPLIKPHPCLKQAAQLRQIKIALGFSENDFVICSFGFLTALKLNHRLLDAWLSSTLSQQKNVHLVFVGEQADPNYAMQITKLLVTRKNTKRVRITGFVDPETFQAFLSITDLAVQLRTNSHGETSATILDCMNSSIPTIINAHGSATEIPSDCVYMLPDEFTNAELITALETMRENRELASNIGQRAGNYIRTCHAPYLIANQYQHTIESFYHTNRVSRNIRLLNSMSSLQRAPDTPTILLYLMMLAFNQAPYRQKILFVDVSAIAQYDLKTGIERVARGILYELLKKPPHGFRVEPVYASETHSYRYARRFTLDLLSCPNDILEETIIEPQPGDKFLMLDLHTSVVHKYQAYLAQLSILGVEIFFIVHDILSASHRHYFPSIAGEMFLHWLAVVLQSSGAICVSRATAEQLKHWVITSQSAHANHFKIGYSHNGTNLDQTSEDNVLVSENMEKTLEMLAKHQNVLMVGTVEPRKGYRQTLHAFDQLWSKNVPVNLVIVGKQGWMVQDLAKKIMQHPQKDKQLFWFQGIDDAELRALYDIADGVLIASEAEGFGLPLIEAAQYRRPILARDIAVFREVAGEHASYFPDDTDPATLAASLQMWLTQITQKTAPKSDNMPWLTWAQSTQQLLTLMFDRQASNWLYKTPHDLNTTHENKN